MTPASAKGSALLTGGTGFVGSWLARRLARDGWEVHLVVRPSSRLPSLLEGERLSLHLHDGTTEGMVRIVGETRPAVVFHLASLFLARHRTPDVEPLVRDNLLFPAQLAEAMAVCGAGRLVSTGTSWQHYQDREYDPVCLYAATKQAFADLLAYWTGSGLLTAATLTLFDTYGPGDPRPKLFSLLRRAVEEDKPLPMSGGGQLLDLVFVDDVVEAYLAAAGRLLAGEAGPAETWAVSSGAPLSLREVVALYAKVAGRPVPVQWGGLPYRPREVMRPWSKGLPVPGWAPRVGLEEGIRRTLFPAGGAP